MYVNIQMLIKACEELSYEYKILHESGNLVIVKYARHSHVFANSATPLNSSSVAHLTRDKEYFYKYFEFDITMPKTKGYLNPLCNIEYQRYLKYPHLEAIIKDIEFNFDYPVIAKRNKGSLGVNVFKCYDQSEVINALNVIYDFNHEKYDYVAVIQQYIDIKNEYRALFLDGELHCAYEKDISQAIFTGNLSRLHWQGAQAKLVSDLAFLERIQQFCYPVFQNRELRYAGLDIALDVDNKLWLIEANSSPLIDYLVRDCGEELAISWYKKALLLLFNSST